MSDNTYDQRVQLHGGAGIHGAVGSGDVMRYAHTACNLTIISLDTPVDPSTPVTCAPCARTMKEE